MLFIKYGAKVAGQPVVWFVNQYPDVKPYAADVVYIWADNDELAYIKARFRGSLPLPLPLPTELPSDLVLRAKALDGNGNEAKCVTWFGDWARFIVANL